MIPQKLIVFPYLNIFKWQFSRLIYLKGGSTYRVELSLRWIYLQGGSNYKVDSHTRWIYLQMMIHEEEYILDKLQAYVLNFISFVISDDHN